MSVLPFFQWCEASALGTAIRDSRWLFPVIEAVHLLGLAMMGGVVLLVDMRLMGLAMPRKPVAALAREIQPWLIGTLTVMLITGAAVVHVRANEAVLQCRVLDEDVVPDARPSSTPSPSAVPCSPLTRRASGRCGEAGGARLDRPLGRGRRRRTGDRVLLTSFFARIEASGIATTISQSVPLSGILSGLHWSA